MQKKYLNRIISLSICFVLFLLSLVFLYEKDAYSSGAGTKQSAAVTTMEELNEVFQSVSYLSESNGAWTDDSVKHSSVTVTETTDLHVDSYTYQQGIGFSSSSLYLSRSLSMYFTETATAYRSTGRIVTSSSSNRTKVNKSAIDFSMDVYVSADKVLFNIEKWDMESYQKLGATEQTEVDDESYQLIKEMTGKWIDATSVPVMVEMLLSVNMQNVDALSILGSIINSYVNSAQTDIFKENNKRYELAEDLLPIIAQQLTASVLLPFTVRGSVIADLSDKKAPAIYEELRCVGSDQTEGNSDFYTSASCLLRDTLVFSNIDNTVIHDKNIEATDILTLFN